MLYTDSPTGSLLRAKIDEYNSSTTGLIMSMVTMMFFYWIVGRANHVKFVIVVDRFWILGVVYIKKCQSGTGCMKGRERYPTGKLLSSG